MFCDLSLTCSSLTSQYVSHFVDLNVTDQESQPNILTPSVQDPPGGGGHGNQLMYGPPRAGGGHLMLALLHL